MDDYCCTDDGNPKANHRLDGAKTKTRRKSNGISTTNLNWFNLGRFLVAINSIAVVKSQKNLLLKLVGPSFPISDTMFFFSLAAMGFCKTCHITGHPCRTRGRIPCASR